MAHRAYNKQKHAFAAALDRSRLGHVKTELRHSDKILNLTDSVRPYVHAKLSVTICDRHGRDQRVLIESTTKEREVYAALAKAYDCNVMPSSFRIKAVSEAFNQLLKQILEAIRQAKDLCQTERVIQILNKDFKKRKRIQSKKEYDDSKTRFEILLKNGFANITEEHLVDLFREFKIRSVMEV